MRDIRQAAVDLMLGAGDWVKLVAAHDPDMIRDVARELCRRLGPAWTTHTVDCAVQDNEYGPCTCGVDERWREMLTRAPHATVSEIDLLRMGIHARCG